MLSSCWNCFSALFTHGRATDPTTINMSANMARPVAYDEEEDAPEAYQAHAPEEEPENEPWHLSREQADHLRQAFPNFQEQPLSTPSDAAFAEWLQQGMMQ